MLFRRDWSSGGLWCSQRRNLTSIERSVISSRSVRSMRFVLKWATIVSFNDICQCGAGTSLFLWWLKDLYRLVGYPVYAKNYARRNWHRILAIWRYTAFAVNRHVTYSVVALICIFNANYALLSFYAVWRSYILLTVSGYCFRDVEIIWLQHKANRQVGEERHVWVSVTEGASEALKLLSFPVIPIPGLKGRSNRLFLQIPRSWKRAVKEYGGTEISLCLF